MPTKQNSIRFSAAGIRGLMIQAFLAAVIVSFQPAAGAQESSPLQTVNEFHEHLKTLNFDAEKKIKNDAARQKVNSFLDLEAMGRAALHSHWDAAEAAQRQEFMSLLWKLVESIAYRNSQDFLSSGKVLCESGPADPDDGKVSCTIQEEGEVLETSLVYSLQPEGGGWKIRDVVLDEVSLTTDLRYQFDKLIQEDGFEKLLSRMQEKLRIVRQTSL